MPTRHINHYQALRQAIPAAVCAALLSACQTTPAPQKTRATPVVQPKTADNPASPAVIHENGAKRTPLSEAAQPPLQSSSLPSAPGTVPPPRVVQPSIVLRDGSNIPAFRALITRAQQQIQSGQYDAAEQTLIQAQRMGPQSTAVYAYLSQVAIAKRQGSNAEAMARKGLMLTKNPRQQQAFWQLILASAQLQNNPALASQAQQQIQQLSGQF